MFTPTIIPGVLSKVKFEHPLLPSSDCQNCIRLSLPTHYREKIGLECWTHGRSLLIVHKVKFQRSIWGSSYSFYILYNYSIMLWLNNSNPEDLINDPNFKPEEFIEDGWNVYPGPYPESEPETQSIGRYFQ